MNPPALAFADVTIRLGSHEAIRSLSFSLPEGAFLAIIGPNGAGKSTLIKAMLGLVPPTQGAIRLYGGPPGDLGASDFGYIPQLKSLDRGFPALAIELVVEGIRGAWPWRIRPEERARALQALALAGMEGKEDRSLGALSGGEMQRVYLARAFAREPRFLLLDEPATGMDAVGEADMYRLLEAWRAGRKATLVMVTHDWEVARHHATHVLLLNRSLVGFGSPREVLTASLLRRAYGHEGHLHPMAITDEDGLDGAHTHGHGHDHGHGHAHHPHHGHDHGHTSRPEAKD